MEPVHASVNVSILNQWQLDYIQKLATNAISPVDHAYIDFLVCSAGLGRTGAYIAIDLGIRQVSSTYSCWLGAFP